MPKTVYNIKKFTYGHQFESGKAELGEYLALVVEHEPSRENLETGIRNRFFSDHSASTGAVAREDNQRKLAMNCFLSLRAYGLLEGGGGGPYRVTDLTRSLLQLPSEIDRLREFAKHILVHLSGTDLLKAIENVVARGDTPTLRRIIGELNEIGYEIPQNSIYISTMREWLTKAGLFEGQHKIAWDVFYELTQLSKGYVDQLYRLTPEQKNFVISLLELDVRSYKPWPDVLTHVETTKRLDYDLKMFPKTVLEPLEALGILEMSKETGGRGAKPNRVKLTDKAQNDFLLPFLKEIANLTSIEATELNRTFDEILNDLDVDDRHVKGKALELLAIWLIRLCSLRFTKWRKRDFETGHGEVDVLAASDTFVYSRWQVQCKNTNKVDVDVIAKEIGMTFMTNADVVMVVTTGHFTNPAIEYAERLCMHSRYYIILLDGDHLARIRADRSSIIPILNRIARRAFVRREYGATAKETEEIISDVVP
ncbi:MAG: hypothetical protein JW395_1737 [Nitrospira sp.]|nr:hypothetical protein [Nitrospira sp.]